MLLYTLKRKSTENDENGSNHNFYYLFCLFVFQFRCLLFHYLERIHFPAPPDDVSESGKQIILIGSSM